MTHHHEQELGDLKDRLLTMADIAEKSVKLAIGALLDRDDVLSRKLIKDDSLLDDLEIEIDEAAINLLAKAPLATDLRLITMAMKFSRDLERIGDETTTICRRSIELCQEPPLKQYLDDIPKMAAIALEMLGDAMNAFIQRTPDKAREIVPRDKVVDALHKQLRRELSNHMIEKPATITRCLHLMTISKCVERIADHAANIAEEVVFLYEGIDIRHTKHTWTPITHGAEQTSGAGGNNPRARVLVVDNDPDTLELIGGHLRNAGFKMSTATDGEQALKSARELLPDLILLDLALPEIDGLEVCKIIRRDPAIARIPVILLADRAAELDRVLGLELGADDYVTKPFSPRELVLRIKNVLRRGQSSAEQADHIKVGNLLIDIPQHLVLHNGEPVNLTTIEFKLLVLLARRKGRVQSRDQLLRDVWEYDSVIDTRTVDTHVRRLREKLGKAATHLDTVRGVGYRFIDV